MSRSSDRAGIQDADFHLRLVDDDLDRTDNQITHLEQVIHEAVEEQKADIKQLRARVTAVAVSLTLAALSLTVNVISRSW